MFRPVYRAPIRSRWQELTRFPVMKWLFGLSQFPYGWRQKNSFTEAGGKMPLSMSFYFYNGGMPVKNKISISKKQ